MPSRQTKRHAPPTKPYTKRGGSKQKADLAHAAKLASKPAGSSKNGTSSRPFAPGSIVDGRWRILKELGAGGFGAVYAAEHIGNGRRVALKTLHPSLAGSAGHRDMFLREGLVDNLVDSTVRQPVREGPGAVRVYDNGKGPFGAPYLVMEMLDGTPLRTAGLSTPEQVGEALDETLRVLEGAHSRGVIHRDIKPDNLFLTNTGDVRVLDFGLAQMPDDEPHLGYAIGTLGFAPPEQLLGARATPASDVWSVGATGYQLLTGRVPTDPNVKKVDPKKVRDFASGRRDDLGVNWTDLGCPVAPVRTYAPDVPPALARVIDKALQCDPPDRYPTARAMRKDLEQALQTELAFQSLGQRTMPAAAGMNALKRY